MGIGNRCCLLRNLSRAEVRSISPKSAWWWRWGYSTTPSTGIGCNLSTPLWGRSRRSHSSSTRRTFSRKKQNSRFPRNAILYCLKSQSINLSDVKEVLYYEKPLLTFERLLETYMGAAPRGGWSFIAAMQVWIKEKNILKKCAKKRVLKKFKNLSAKFQSISQRFFFQSIIFFMRLQHFTQVPLKNQLSSVWTELVSGQPPLHVVSTYIHSWYLLTSWSGYGTSIQLPIFLSIAGYGYRDTSKYSDKILLWPDRTSTSTIPPRMNVFTGRV